MSYSVVASVAAPGEMLDAVLELCPDFDLVAKVENLQTSDEMYDWCSCRSGYMGGAGGHDAKAAYRNDEWSVLMDFSMLLGAEDAVLGGLSERFGQVVVASTQGTAGFASFALFTEGDLRRRITSSDGELELEGEPIPAEEGITLDRFYIDEVESLWEAHGLESFTSEASGPYCAIHYVDRLEIEGVDAGPGEGGRPPKKQPWWRRW